MKTWNDANDALRQIAVLDGQVTDAAAIRDQQVLDAQTDYARITSGMTAQRAQLVEELEDFYRKQKKSVEADGRRSVELEFGKLGMRKGNPTLKLLKGWKWERVLSAAKHIFSDNKDLLSALVTTKETPNKDGIKSRLDEVGLARIGCRIVQEDEFWFETFPTAVTGGK